MSKQIHIEKNIARLGGCNLTSMTRCPMYLHACREYDLSDIMAGTVKALSPWPELAAQMSDVYSQKLEQLKSGGRAQTILQCDAYYALVLQRQGSAALP